METKDWTNELKKKVESSSSLPGPTVSWDELEAGMDRIVRRRAALRLAGGISAVAAALAFILFLPLNNNDRVRTAEPVAVVEQGAGQALAAATGVIASESNDKVTNADEMAAKESKYNSLKTNKVGNGRVVAEEMVAKKIVAEGIVAEKIVAEKMVAEKMVAKEMESDGVVESEKRAGSGKVETEQKSEELREMGEDAECDIAEWPDDEFWAMADEDDTRRKGRGHRLSIGLGSSTGAVNTLKLGAMDYETPPPQDEIFASSGILPGGGAANDVIASGGIMPDGSSTNNNQGIPHIRWDGPEGPVTVENEGIIPSFSIGLGARYDLSGVAFALGGLSVEQYHATFTETGYEADDFWLLGPYAGLGVNLYQNKGLSIYTALTGHAEWSVKYKDVPVMYSAGLLAGAQINIFRYLALYAEPQIMCRFKSENSHSSVTFEDPLKLNINIGLRFNL